MSSIGVAGCIACQGNLNQQVGAGTQHGGVPKKGFAKPEKYGTNILKAVKVLEYYKTHGLAIATHPPHHFTGEKYQWLA